MSKNLINHEIEKMYEDGVGEVIDNLGSLTLKIKHILPNISITLAQYRTDLVTGILEENGSEKPASYKLATENVIKGLDALSKKLTGNQYFGAELKDEISQQKDKLLKLHESIQQFAKENLKQLNENKMPQKMAVLSLSESARCLGIFQERGDKNAIKYWQGKVQEYESILLKQNQNKPVNTSLKKQKP